MKRWLVATAALLALGLGAILAWQTAAQDATYRRLLARGDAALAEDQTFGAIEAYSGAIALRPDSTIAHLRRGETYQRRGDLGAAARDFREAADLDRGATRPLEELGDVLYQQQKYLLAIEAFDRSLRLDDRQPRVSYKLALARYRDRDLDGAAVAAAAALRTDDRLSDAHYLLGVCRREQHRPADAQRSFERALALAPGLINAREQLAEIYRELGRPADELEQLQLLAGLDRARAERQVAVGLAQARTGHADLAVLTLGSALERTSDQSPIYAALGRVWLDIALARNDRVALSKAIEALERVALASSAPSDVLALYGRALVEDGQFEAAEPILQEAVVRLPVEPSAFLQHAALAERLGHFDAARRSLIAYEALESSDTGLTQHALQIATLSLRLGDAATASEWAKRAADTGHGDSRLLGTIAEAQLNAGDEAGASKTLTRALERDPSNPALLRLQQRIR